MNPQMEMTGFSCWILSSKVMRFRTIFAAYMILLLSCRNEGDVYLFTSFREPAVDGLCLLYSLDGYQWEDLGCSFLKPHVGKGRLMRDPSVVRGPDGTFHLVWTTAWHGDRGFGYSSSTDLVHWSEQRFIPVMDHERETVNVWAPEIFYDEETDAFIIIWASTIPHRFRKGMEEENNNHRMYYTVTKDFKEFSKAQLFLDPGFSAIDGVIAKRGAGSYVLVFKDNTRPNRNLRVAFADRALGPYENVSPPFTPQFTEGPTVARVGDDWLIYFDAYREKRYGVVRTRDFKTFTDISRRISIPVGHKHGTIFKVGLELLNNLKKLAEKR